MKYDYIYEKPLAHGFKKNNCIVSFYNLNKKESVLTHRLRITFLRLDPASD